MPPGGTGAARDVLDHMSLQSKAAQVLLVAFDGTALTDFTKGTFSQSVPAGVLLLKRNVTGEEQLRSLTAALQQAAASAGENRSAASVASLSTSPCASRRPQWP